MRICTMCGTEIPDDELICPHCKHEVQLVPDYETVESQINEHIEKERETQQREDEIRERDEEMLRNRKRRKFKRNLKVLLALLVVAAVIVIGVILSTNKKHNESFDYQYEQAQAAYKEASYDEALTFIQRAIELDADNLDAKMLLADIYIAMDNDNKAIETLKAVIKADDGYASAYDKLIGIYTEQGDTEAIKTLLAGTTDTNILERFKEYLSDEPLFNLESGTYDEEQTLSIVVGSTDGKIYYTTDGTTPTTSSYLYSTPFTLDEGTHTIKAIYVNGKGISGDVSEINIVIELEVPDAPVITPSSGTYTTQLQTGEELEDVAEQITVSVPTGYTCYYSFDSKPTTKSKKYTGAIDMPEGEHVFYAMLEGSNGKTSKISSATYVYKVIEPTPTPTPTPTRQISNISATETRDSETVVTPTPTPTPEPDNSSDSSDSGTSSDTSTDTGTDTTENSGSTESNAG